MRPGDNSTIPHPEICDNRLHPDCAETLPFREVPGLPGGPGNNFLPGAAVGRAGARIPHGNHTVRASPGYSEVSMSLSSCLISIQMISSLISLSFTRALRLMIPMMDVSSLLTEAEV
jgi:hypothetical protein